MIKKFKKQDEIEKTRILDTLKEVMHQHHEIVFAYLHGSFACDEDFNDIDIAVFLKEVPVSALDYELESEVEFVKCLHPYPVDVRILNKAPLSFRYQVIKRGIPLLVNNDNFRTDFIETTLTDYFDFSFYRDQYLREVLDFGI